MKIAIACDHGALELKNNMKTHLSQKGYEVVDFGTHTLDSCDYPDFAAPAAKAVANGECEKGIVLCTTGIGVSITCNKVKGIRCALLSDVMSARMTREHNDTNMMAIGAGVVGQMLALEIADTWLGTEFSHNERHQRRIDKVMALEME
jgi:ribose 5-phosphate isomerase B